jgi:polar amino acid transport system substrate-binding protein
MKQWLRRSLFLACVLLLVAFTTMACGDDEEEEEGGTTPGAGAAVPELEDGTLQVLADIAYAPMEYYEAGTNEAKGFDIDLALQAKDGDVLMSSMTVTPEREEEIDFIPYADVGTGILVKSGNPEDIAKLEDLCGLTVTVQEGTIQQDMLDDLNADACSDNKIDMVTFDQNPLAVEELRVGGADAVLADFPVALNDANQSDGELEVVGEQFDAAPYGIGLRKDSTELKSALEDALNEIKDDGTYDSVLKDWGLESASLE